MFFLLDEAQQSVKYIHILFLIIFIVWRLNNFSKKCSSIFLSTLEFLSLLRTPTFYSLFLFFGNVMRDYN